MSVARNASWDPRLVDSLLAPLEQLARRDVGASRVLRIALLEEIRQKSRDLRRLVGRLRARRFRNPGLRRNRAIPLNRVNDAGGDRSDQRGGRDDGGMAADELLRPVRPRLRPRPYRPMLHRPPHVLGELLDGRVPVVRFLLHRHQGDGVE
jgi:hypothetical protein